MLGKTSCFLIFVCSISLIILWLTYLNYYVVNESRLKNEKLYKALQAKVLNKPRVNISVYYEALCPDSRSFFVRHLLPAYIAFEDNINIDLIPYGKSNTRIEGGKLMFYCQHGPSECLGNKIHACAIQIIQNPLTKIQFTTCLISDLSDQIAVGSMCAVKYGIPWDNILMCAKGSQGDLLHNNHGKRTKILDPPISFIPTVLLNNNRHSQTSILKNLHRELCSNYKNMLKEC